MQERQKSPARRSSRLEARDCRSASGPERGSSSLPAGAQEHSERQDSRLRDRDGPRASETERGRAEVCQEASHLDLRDCMTSVDLGPRAVTEPTRSGLGVVLRLPGGTESHDIAVRLVDSAEQYVRLFGFTYDRGDITEALKKAKLRGVDVAVGVDRKWTLNGRTRDQLARLKELEAHGVVTRVVSGSSTAEEYHAVGRSVSDSVGILHAKAVHTDKGTLVGSANWTTSSRSNIELGVELSLDDLAAAELKDYMSSVIDQGFAVTDAEVLAAQWSQSESPSRRRGWR
jgi:phosphatidylserine/phosphatidylglycerophosphate/cardiolipin synthase-like enzyme